MKILIYGATSRIAHECAKLWASEGNSILLAGRNLARLESVASDLRVISGMSNEISTYVLDVADECAARQRLTEADALVGGFDLALIAHGSLQEQAVVQRDPARLRETVEVNALSVAQLCETIAEQFEIRRRGTLAVIGSVAGDRGRQSNYAYGASKAFVERYCEGLRNRLYPAGVRVVLIKPGPTDTPMTQQLAPKSKRLAHPRRVAADIVRGIAKGQDVIYTPGVWRWIMTVIAAIPERVFVRLKL